MGSAIASSKYWSACGSLRRVVAPQQVEAHGTHSDLQSLLLMQPCKCNAWYLLLFQIHALMHSISEAQARPSFVITPVCHAHHGQVWVQITHHLNEHDQ